ncbi:hypothetical protein [Bacteroides sp. 519]|uniref:hypothetical protein n=1 Tax=Bacteroides sp. 519 TaxID=2302937 RepID=UPI0013D1CD23|nr:hypothetical protein [Bacteroides sp. 519]NDV57649.1 hypothetical protein [Bacteroides sp. 519]
MDGILNILLVLGFIGFAVFKQVLKPDDSSEKKTPPVPFDMDEVFPEVTPVPPLAKSPPTIKRTKAAEFPKKTVDKTREVINSPLQEDEAVNSDIDTQSIEEIRKGIIWSEILNRKY